MKILSAIWQGIIQGLTEFLPVSSSGHLSLFQHFSGTSGEEGLVLTAVLHLGTLVAVCAVFYKDIWKLIKEFISMIKDIFTRKFSVDNASPERRLLFMFIISTAMLIPFAIFKGFFESFAEDGSILMEGICFLYTAAILFMADMQAKGSKKMTDLKYSDSVKIGFFQGVALLPGVSRSGSTISAGIFCGLSREAAVSYSFILGIPAIIAGCITEIGGAIGSESSTYGFLPCLIGFIVAAVVGFVAIRLIQYIIKTEKFKIFWIYTGILGVIVIIIAILEAIVGHAFVIGG
ncbi:MAG: undecaprenyl-diphosphate phosphatase [Oscillospiraceae bacterium]|nr:undecaprenyl-diphosphate phosphatase [Oscillospiraceae bacterium]